MGYKKNMKYKILFFFLFLSFCTIFFLVGDIYPIDSNFDNVSFSEKSKINTCLEHDYLSRLINKILRTFHQGNQKLFEPFETLLLNICNQKY